MNYKTKSNTLKSRYKRNRSRGVRKKRRDLYTANQNSAFRNLIPSMAQGKTAEVIMHEANGGVNKSIKAEYIADIKANSEVLAAKLSTAKSRHIYQRMYNQEATDNDRAVKVLEKYFDGCL